MRDSAERIIRRGDGWDHQSRELACYFKGAADAARELLAVSDGMANSVPVAPPHETVPMQVWADIDVGVAEMVKYLNTIPGVRTYAACQGGESYRPYVMVSWPDEATLTRLSSEFDFEDVDMLGSNTAHFRPREKMG